MPNESNGPILEELRKLNAQIAHQGSLWRSFVVGIFYGVGFFVGSAIIATIALGMFGPWFVHIPFIESYFTGGMHILGR